MNGGLISWRDQCTKMMIHLFITTQSGDLESHIIDREMQL